MLSVWQILLILVIVVIFFGPGRIEKLGPALGKALRGFKKGLGGSGSDDSDSDAKLINEQSDQLKSKIESLEKRSRSTKDED